MPRQSELFWIELACFLFFFLVLRAEDIIPQTQPNSFASQVLKPFYVIQERQL